MTHAGQTERGVLDLDTLTIARARNLLRKRQLGAVELIEATLRRIDQTEPLVHAYVQVLAEPALVAARQADARRSRGSLQGIPIGIKDVLVTRDAPTAAGSRLLAGYTTNHDATVVRRLREAGVVIVGKQVTHEFACGQNVPPTRNPWDLRHYPGGSSAGGVDYFFTLPQFRLWPVREARDVVTLIGFLTTALVINRLIRRMRQSFKEVEAAHEQLRLVIDTMPILLTSARPDGALEFVNQQWRDFLGLSLEEIQSGVMGGRNSSR